MLKQYKLRQTKEAWKIGQRESVVFSDFIHEYPSSSRLKRRLQTHFKRADVPNIGFHGFRHTHASLLLNSGIPYKELQYRLGHSTLSMTMDIYSPPLKRERKKSSIILRNCTKSTIGGAKRGANLKINISRQSKNPIATGFLLDLF